MCVPLECTLCCLRHVQNFYKGFNTCALKKNNSICYARSKILMLIKILGTDFNFNIYSIGVNKSVCNMV